MVGQTLYSRKVQSDHNEAWLHTQEEILNHFFDLTFAIAPDDLVERILLKPFEFIDLGHFESLGREVRDRYNWGYNENVTQQDGLFVSNKTALAVELKLGSKSSRSQIIKYAALLAWEERTNGTKDQLGLLYIVPENARMDHWKKCGVADPDNIRFLLENVDFILPPKISAFLAEEPQLIRSVCDRMKLEVITWHDLRFSLETYRQQLNLQHRGDQTLDKLIAGFLDQLSKHQETGLKS
ncbi:hypothetical protein ABAC460_08055 [Asticcacaulis sp. AC460]|nr:hypothetical protein ABAC460_08055 [Asticcacaulis sp. AC460]